MTHGMLSALRFNATSDTLDITNRILRSTEAELRQRGYPVRRWALNFHFAAVHAIQTWTAQFTVTPTQDATGWRWPSNPRRSRFCFCHHTDV